MKNDRLKSKSVNVHHCPQEVTLLNPHLRIGVVNPNMEIQNFCSLVFNL